MQYNSGIETTVIDLLVRNALQALNTSIVEGSGDFDRMKSTLTAPMPQLVNAKAAHGEQRPNIAIARPLYEWHEDYGDVVWWAWDDEKKEWFGEPAYIGTPLDSNWPAYHTHWTPHPTFPIAPTSEKG